LGHGGSARAAGGASLPIVKNAATTTAATASAALAWATEADTAAFAARLAACPALRDAYVELRGNLGAGKTTLVRHLLRALGVQGRIKSPTYAVVEPYELPGLNIWHFDFYRFSDPREWADAGFRDIFASPGLKIAEWPDKVAGQLPAADLVVGIEVQDDDMRQVAVTAQTAIGLALLAAAQTTTPAA
jgi:tRNA threonylcarbamoyladenosine biosynthesis protein TsaE